MSRCHPAISVGARMNEPDGAQTEGVFHSLNFSRPNLAVAVVPTPRSGQSTAANYVPGGAPSVICSPASTAVCSQSAAEQPSNKDVELHAKQQKMTRSSIAPEYLPRVLKRGDDRNVLRSPSRRPRRSAHVARRVEDRFFPSGNELRHTATMASTTH